MVNFIMKPTLFLLAAGMGSRYGGLKQLDKLGPQEQTIMDYSIYDAINAGFGKLVFVIRKDFEEDFRNIVLTKYQDKIPCELVFQALDALPEGFTCPEGREKPWGTGHAVLAARKLIDAPFAVINADDYYGAGAFQSMYDFLDKAKDDDKYRYSMVGYRLDKTLTENGHVARGICTVDDKNNLVSVVERTKIMRKGDAVAFTEDDGQTWTEVAGDTIVSMNFWGFTKSMMNELEKKFPRFFETSVVENPLKGEYFLPGVVSELLAENKATVKVLTSQDKWYGVTYKEDKQGVASALRSMKDKGLYPEILWK